MSLVYEALRKAEREKERKAGQGSVVAAPVVAAPVAPGKALPQSAPVRPSRRWPVVVALAGFVIAVGAVVFLMRKPAVVAVEESRSTAPAPEPRPSIEPPPSQPPAPTTENDSRFKLTGIMKMGDAYGAVINGRVVYEGHYVDGVTVKSIERDRVKLEQDGREILVRLF